MNALDVIQRANELGLTLSVSDEKIQFRPKSAAPVDFVDELRRNKDEVLDYLRQRAKRSLSQCYEQRFQSEDIIDDELAEFERRVEAEGVVLCHSELLNDFIAFHCDDVDPATIPAGFVSYSDRELRELFGPNKPAMSANALRRIHAAKKTGANIISNQPEESELDDTE